MAKRSIDDFKSVLSGGGIRPNMFEVEIAPPRALLENRPNQLTNFRDISPLVDAREVKNYMMLVKSTSIPASTTTTVNMGLPAGGILKLPGSRIYDTWQAQIINDNKMSLRGFFEDWSASIIHHGDFIHEANFTEYTSTVEIRQLNRAGDPIRLYKLEYAYPATVDAEQLSYEAVNTISEFGVVFNYHYFTSEVLSPESNYLDRFPLLDTITNLI